MLSNKIGILALALTVAVLPSACGSNGPKVTESKSGDKATTVKQPSSGDLKAYFEDLASEDPATMDGARKLAAPGSVAQAYAIHQIAATNAFLDGGTPADKQVLTSINGGFKNCQTDITNGDAPCTTFTKLSSTAGKISSFAVGGQDISKRISLGDGKTTAVGGLGDAKFISSYVTSANALWVIFEVHSKSQTLEINTTSFKYRAPDGRQSTASSDTFGGPTELQGDSKATIIAIFDKAAPGGEVTMDFSDKDYNTELYPKVKIG